MLARRLAPCNPVHATSPDRPQTLDSGSAAIVRGDAAAAVVRGGDHRDGFAREVDAALHADGVDAGKTFAKLVGRLVRNVEIDARLARLEHRLVDGARGNVARRQRAGGMEPLHEFLPVTIHQTAALAAYRLGNQEAAVGRQQRRRMKLDVLHVDAARPGAVSHGDAVAARPGGICRVQEDAAEPARGKNGFLGQEEKIFPVF